jgi:hypothetical protein
MLLQWGIGMRLCKVVIENFRGYKHRTEINISDFTSVVGRNDVGKSTILEALEVFFNCELVKIDQHDTNVSRREHPARIACVFDGYPSEITIDVRSTTSLQDEFLLNEDGLLEIVKSWDCNLSKPKCSVFARAVHPSLEGVADLLQLKQPDLKKRAADLGVDLSAVDQRSNTALRAAIRGHFRDLQLQTTELPLLADDGKKVWEQLERWMPTFALFQSDRPSKDDDPEIQDPMKLAVQEAVKAVQGELESIKKQVEERAIEVASRTLAKLREMDPNLANHLKPVFKAEPKWDGFRLSLTGDEDIPINKRGSGVRRLILLNFFRAEAERRRGELNSPGVIYAIEEPENSQHPNNQAMLIKALLELSRQPNTQVLLTTHVPGIAGMLPAESIRYIRRGSDSRPEVLEGDDTVLQQVATDLGIIPDNRASVLVYVEGPHDVSFLGHMNRLLRTQHSHIIDIENDPRVAFVVTGGGNLRHWVNKQYLEKLGRAEVHIYDRDEATPPKYQEFVDAVNARSDRSWACLTAKREMENYLHADAITTVLNVTVTFTDTCDVPALVAEAQHAASESPNPWSSLKPEKQGSKISVQKKRLNEDVAPRMTLAQLMERDPQNEILGWFEQITVRVDPNWAPVPDAAAA